MNYQEVIYGPILFLTKLSILLQYLRLFVPTHKGKTYYLIQCNIWLNLLFYILFCLLSTLACIPRRKIWEPSTPGHCINEKLFLIITAAFNIVSDFSILLLPLGKIWRLQMPVRRKVGVSTPPFYPWFPPGGRVRTGGPSRRPAIFDERSEDEQS